MPEVLQDPHFVAARHVLLDGLEALKEQRRAAILIGAHAIYLRVGQGSLATTPMTTDADLALDPVALGDQPLLDEALRNAGFAPKIGSSGPVVGSWTIEKDVSGRPVDIDLDLLVPEAVSGPGTRAARLGPQGDRLARKAVGLELVLIDNDVMTVDALDLDPRAFQVRVAGVASLLISKAHKVAERLDDPRRDDRIAKDALDMLRLLQGSDPRPIAAVLLAATTDAIGEPKRSLAATVEAGVSILREHFATPQARGCLLAGRAAAGRHDPRIVAASLAALADRLLDLL